MGEAFEELVEAIERERANVATQAWVRRLLELRGPDGTWPLQNRYPRERVDDGRL